MHTYEVHIWVNGQCIKTNITANTPSQARIQAEAQYPAARMINVIRQIS